MRSTLLALVVGSACGAAGLLVVDRYMAARTPPPAFREVPPGGGIWDDRFPNLTLQTHDGRTVRFYDDLIEGRILALNFFYIACTKF